VKPNDGKNPAAGESPLVEPLSGGDSLGGAAAPVERRGEDEGEG